MILVGFGCSITEGSNLAEDPSKNYDYNTPYRLQNCWLGQLSQLVGATYLNLADAGGSNFFISQQVAQFVNYEMHQYSDHQIVFCIAWTEVDRTSWWNEHTFKWVHSKHVELKIEKVMFRDTFKEWVLHSRGDEASGNQALTDSAKLFVNSFCEANNIPIIQFNALGNHRIYHKHKNYYLPESNTQDYLTAEHLLPCRHPNELGHEEIATRLHNFIKEHKIV